VLAALFADDVLLEALVSEGGTASKQAEFGDCRFSVDLDFTSAAPRFVLTRPSVDKWE